MGGPLVLCSHVLPVEEKRRAGTRPASGRVDSAQQDPRWSQRACILMESGPVSSQHPQTCNEAHREASEAATVHAGRRWLHDLIIVDGQDREVRNSAHCRWWCLGVSAGANYAPGTDPQERRARTLELARRLLVRSSYTRCSMTKTKCLWHPFLASKDFKARAKKGASVKAA